MSTNSALSKYKFLGLFPLVMAQIGTSGDNSVLTVATASLLASLNATMSDIQLANIIYSLCAGCLMIVGGMVGLIVGWKKTFRIGAAMCAVGELVVAFSGNIFMFTWGGRLLVGIGASFLIPSVLGLIPGLYQGNDRAFAFGAIGAATGIASCLGPIAAGFLIDTFDWRIAFSCMAVYFTIVFVGSLLVGDVPLRPDSRLEKNFPHRRCDVRRRRTCRSFLRQHFYVHLGRPSAGRYRRQFPYPFCPRADPRFVSGQ